MSRRICSGSYFALSTTVMRASANRRLVRPGIVTFAASRSPVPLPPRAARTPLSIVIVIGVSSRGMASAAEWTKADSLNLS